EKQIAPRSNGGGEVTSTPGPGSVDEHAPNPVAVPPAQPSPGGSATSWTSAPCPASTDGGSANTPDSTGDASNATPSPDATGATCSTTRPPPAWTPRGTPRTVMATSPATRFCTGGVDGSGSSPRPPADGLRPAESDGPDPDPDGVPPDPEDPGPGPP